MFYSLFCGSVFRTFSTLSIPAISTWLLWGGLLLSTMLFAAENRTDSVSDWKLLGRISDGQVYLDTLTMVTDEQGITHADVRLDYASPTEIGPLLLVGQLAKVRINCAQKQSATDRISVTQQDGKRFIMASYEAAPFEQIPAGSANALLMSELCATAL